MPVQNTGQMLPATHDPTNLGDILERVLDRGVVIAGDIRVNLLDIELLTIKLRLVVASVDTARQMGIDWWERDPFLTSRPGQPLEEDSPAGQLESVPEPGQLENPPESGQLEAGAAGGAAPESDRERVIDGEEVDGEERDG